MTTKFRKNEEGLASILALLLLCIFSTLAVSFATFTSGNVVQAGNHASVQSARLQAEGGLGFLLPKLADVSLPSNATAQDIRDAVAAALETSLNGTANLAGSTVGYDGTTVTIPSIVTDDGSFFAYVTVPSDTGIHLVVTGRSGNVSRSVGIDLTVSSGSSAVFDYGIASKSAISMIGNSKVTGANSADEADILSATYTAATAVSLKGNTKIEGNIYVSNPTGEVYLTSSLPTGAPETGNVQITGNATVGGESGAAAEANVYHDAGNPEFPEVDPTVFEPFATNVISTSTNASKTLTNIRIAANTNPTFSGNTVIKGIVFIETPNKVKFTGNLTLTGMIVTEDAGDDAYTTNTISFTGNSTFYSVESLPDTTEFAGLRDMPGSFLLAPGFGVSFTGNFGAVNGTMAADAFTWTGNASGTIHGTIINYSDSAFSLTGNSSIVIDRSTYTSTPPGFSTSVKITVDPSTYREY